MQAEKQYYAHGKLLLTGEYAVLDGALSLAVPCKFGQHLIVNSDSQVPGLQWISLDHEGHPWLEVEFDANINISQSSDLEKGEKLRQILTAVFDQNPDFKSELIGKKVITELEFNRHWGLGSSSTLIHLLSQWAQVDPYVVLEKTFGGSGYDLACASADGSILFQRKSDGISAIRSPFNPAFSNQIWFVYLGQKQTSSKEIKSYSSLDFDRDSFQKKVSDLTKDFLEAKDLRSFQNAIQKHEELLSETLQRPTVKSERFPSINGAIKSLGAWGGDFVMFAGESAELEKFKGLGYDAILSWDEMVLNSPL